MRHGDHQMHFNVEVQNRHNLDDAIYWTINLNSKDEDRAETVFNRASTELRTAFEAVRKQLDFHTDCYDMLNDYLCGESGDSVYDEKLGQQIFFDEMEVE